MNSLRTSSYHLFGGLTYKIVLDSNFSVKNVNNLFVIDGSVFPRATEINPFNTISALGGFITKEFVQCPASRPTLTYRVQFVNNEEKNACLATNNPIYAENCNEMSANTQFLI